MRTTATCLLSALLVLAIACSQEDPSGQGGDGGPGGGGGIAPCGIAEAACPAAEAFSPCGGDPTGLWTWESSCRAMRLVGPVFEGCEDGTTEYELAYRGTTSLEGGVRSDHLLSTWVQRWVLPATCIDVLDPGRAIQDVCEDLTGLVADMMTDEIIGSQECTRCADGCNCRREVTNPRPVGTADGPYVIDGDWIDARGWRQQFCVEGDRLHLLDEMSDGSILVATLRRTSG